MSMNGDGLFTQFAHISDQIIAQYNGLSERARGILRRRGFERRHITALLKLKQAMIDANFLTTGNAGTGVQLIDEPQMELKL